MILYDFSQMALATSNHVQRMSLMIGQSMMTLCRQPIRETLSLPPLVLSSSRKKETLPVTGSSTETVMGNKAWIK